MKTNLILGSASPRRAELLKSLGFTFKVESIDADEVWSEDIEITKVAEHLSKIKSYAFPYELKSNELLITADTTVCFMNNILGKPKNEQEAIEILTKLSGQTHEVITGVTLRSPSKEISFSTITNVRFDNFDLDDIKAYIATGSPFDKAGAYGIQDEFGMKFVKKIDGSYTNVVGLPTNALYNQLQLF